VPCERVFSASKETARARRSRLKPLIMEALQILKYQAKHGMARMELNFTEGLGEKDEQVDLEAEEKAKPVEDLPFYLKSIHEREYEDEDEDEDKE
jgi:hypothetical protein